MNNSLEWLSKHFQPPTLTSSTRNIMYLFKAKSKNIDSRDLNKIMDQFKPHAVERHNYIKNVTKAKKIELATDVDSEDDISEVIFKEG